MVWLPVFRSYSKTRSFGIQTYFYHLNPVCRFPLCWFYISHIFPHTTFWGILNIIPTTINLKCPTLGHSKSRVILVGIEMDNWQLLVQQKTLAHNPLLLIFSKQGLEYRTQFQWQPSVQFFNGIQFSNDVWLWTKCGSFCQKPLKIKTKWLPFCSDFRWFDFILGTLVRKSA